MRYAYIRDDTVMFIETDGENLKNKYHIEVLSNFKQIPHEQYVAVGDRYIDGKFLKPTNESEYQFLMDSFALTNGAIVKIMDVIASNMGGTGNV